MNTLVRPHPVLEDTARDAVERHCFSTTTEEVGGFLIGDITSEATVIVAALPAEGAKASQVSMTFTHESWDAALKAVSDHHPGKSIVGWYHSHPGFGLFLSGHDAFIQQNFFGAAGQVALVVDPVEGSLGWFYYDGSQIVELERKRTVRGPVSKPTGPNHEGSGRGAGRAALVGTATAAAVVGLLGGWLLGAQQNSDTVAALDEQVQQLEANPPAPAPVPTEGTADSPAKPETTLVYRVQPGDTLTRIASSFGADVTVEGIVDANDGIDPDSLAIGQRLTIPLGGGE